MQGGVEIQAACYARGLQWDVEQVAGVTRGVEIPGAGLTGVTDAVLQGGLGIQVAGGITDAVLQGGLGIQVAGVGVLQGGVVVVLPELDLLGTTVVAVYG